MEPDVQPQARPYLFRATDSSGKSVVQEVVSDSTSGALRLAQDQGYSNVQVLTDEFAAILPTGQRPGAPRLSPKDLEQIQKNRGPWAARFHILQIVYRPFGVSPLLGLAGIVACAFRLLPPYWYVICAIPIALPLVIALATRRGSANLHRKIQELYVDADFESVLKLIPRFEKSMKGRMADNFIAYAIAEWQGKALARSGRLDEAMLAIDQVGARPGITPVQTQSLRMMVYGAARQWEAMAECTLELERLDPTNPIGAISRTEVFAVWLNRPAEARSLLEGARGMIVSAKLQHFFSLVEAQVLLAERRYGEARASFESVLPFLKAQVSGTPIVCCLVALAETQLAIACAHLGDMPAARRCWQSAEPLMRLHQVEPWVTRAQRAVGAIEASPVRA